MMAILMTSSSTNANAANQLTSPQGESAPSSSGTSYNGLALTPPMGYNGWYRFGCNMTESQVLAQADALVSSGLAKLGYNYVNLDDCWMAPERDASGNLQADPTKFPHGITWLADQIHSMGLKFGLYESVGTTTCNGLPGSYGHYQQDAQTFASWGVDFFKFDFCGSTGGESAKSLVKEMSDDLLATGRPIVFSQEATTGQSASADKSIIAWSSTMSNMWRTSADLATTQFASVLRNFQDDLPLAEYAHPGAWNDLDMVLTGNTQTNWTVSQQETQMSIWAELASPLLVSTDLTNMSADTQRILSNKDLIAIDQDPLGAQGHLVAQQGPVYIVAKPLSNGDVAVLFVNTSPFQQQTASVSTQAIGMDKAPAYALRNLWTNQTTETAGTIQTYMAPYSSVMYRVSPSRPMAGAPSAAITVDTPLTFTPGTASPVQISLTDTGRLPVQSLSLELTLPSSDWTMTAVTSTSFDTVPPGKTVSATWTVTPPTSAASTGTITAAATYTYAGQLVKLAASFPFYILPATVYPDLASAFNIVGITDDSQPHGGQFFGTSYSAEALAAFGFTPGATFVHDSLAFKWPSVAAGTPDAVAGKALVSLTGTGNTLGFLGTAINGGAMETVLVIYADGSVEPHAVYFPNWTDGSNPGYGAVSVAAMPRRNPPEWTYPVNLYEMTVPLNPNKEVSAVLLPSDPWAIVFSMALGTTP
jgi:alpha-galactosidase